MSNKMKGAKSVVPYKDKNKAERRYEHLVHAAKRKEPFAKHIGSKPIRQIRILAEINKWMFVKNVL